MTSDIRYALVYSAERRSGKVTAYGSLDQLARSIHQLRREAAIELQEDDKLFQGEAAERRVVSVFTLDEYGLRQGFIGLAYLDGRGRPTLEAALRGAQREAQPIAVAA